MNDSENEDNNLTISILKKKFGIGRGQGGSGLGKGGVRRHKKPTYQNVSITNGSIKRLARRGGVKRLSNGVYEETRKILKIFMEKILRDAYYYMEYSKRKTIMVSDIFFSLKKNQRTLYGDFNKS